MRFIGACTARAGCLALLLLAPTVWAAADSTPALSLREAIDAALSGNPELQGQVFAFRAQDARVEQAGLRPAPELSLAVENALGSGEFRRGDAAEYTLALSQVLELGGKRDARIAVAQANRDALETARQARQLDVLAEVTRRFITVATRQEQVQLAQRAVQLAQQAVTGAERRVNAAKSPHAELDRARIALDRTRIAARSSALELDIARRQLAACWGETGTVIGGRAMGQIQADLFHLPPTPDYAELLRRLAANPDFLRFASAARVHDAELRLATALRRPDLTLGGGVRRLQASGDQAVLASVVLPLFGSRRAEPAIAEAQALRQQVDAERHAADIKAQALLYELYRQLERAIAEAGALQADILPRTEEALRETEYAYARGRYSYLELVDAQREYLAVQAALIEAASNAHAVRVEIERLTGAALSQS